MNFTFKTGKGLYATYSNIDLNPDDLISEFEPFIVKIIRSCDMRTMTESDEYIVAVKDINGKAGKEVSLQSLHKISYFKTFNCPDSLLTSKHRQILEYKLQQEASKMEPERKYIYPPGLYYMHDKTPVFSLGSQLYFGDTNKTESQTIEQSAFRLKPYKNDLNLDMMLPEIAKDFISFFPGVSEILFYGSLLGIVKPFLAVLNFPPDFILAIIGKSGSMKTSLVRRYALWLDTPEIQEETFQSCSQMSDILSQVDNMQGFNFLMDDLHNVYGSQAKNRQNDRLDKLTRHICTNPRCANVIITGENMNNMAIFSAYDRMFQVTVPQISSDVLQNMKKKINQTLQETFMTELAAMFTKRLMSRFSKVLTDIQTFINHYHTFGFEQPSTRISRHIQVLRIVEFLYRTYICNGNEDLSCKSKFEQSLQKNADYQQKSLIYQRRNEDIDYIKAVFECLTAKDKYINVCTSADDYLPSSSTCLMENDYFFITSAALTTALSKYLNTSVNIKKVATTLRDGGLLDTDTDALTKKKFGHRHYKINYTLLENAYKTIPDIC